MNHVNSWAQLGSTGLFSLSQFAYSISFVSYFKGDFSHLTHVQVIKNCCYIPSFVYIRHTKLHSILI